MRLLLITGLSLMVILLKAQNGHFAIQPLSYKTPLNRTLVFPVVRSKNDTFTSIKINNYLQLAHVGILQGFEESHIFEMLVDQDGLYGGMYQFSYKIESNSNKVLSIVFDKYSCGVTCASWTDYDNFNSGNGDRIILKELFTNTGFQLFRKLVLEKRKAEYDSSDSTETLWVLHHFEVDEFEDFYIKGNEIVLDGKRSFEQNHKMPDFHFLTTVKLKEFERYLSDYGKALFLDNTVNIAEFRSKNLPQIFSGSMNDKYPFLMLLKATDNKSQTIWGAYAYLKYGKAIELRGHLIGTELLLSELDENYEEIAIIEATYEGLSINGTWSDDKRSATYSLKAERK